MAADDKLKTSMDMEASSQNNHRFSFGFPVNFYREKISFFGSHSRRVKSDAWFISLLVILHIVTFVATMTVNDCATKSHGECIIGALGRFSFQPLSENPLLGPAASTLNEMGALQRTLLMDARNSWRLITCVWLHAGVFHLLVNLASLIFVGTYMEQEFGPLRVGIIYALSAFLGCLLSTFFVGNSPTVCASAASFGLIGAMLSALTRDWGFYSHKAASLALTFFILIVNLIIGLLPYADNFSSIGGFISGFLLGLVLLFTPETGIAPQRKADLFDGDAVVKGPIKLKEKLDRPIMRSVALAIFGLLLAVCVLGVQRRVDMNRYCTWCRYIDCIPLSWWNCNDLKSSCETMVGEAELTLTCLSNGNFKILSYHNISEERLGDICAMICKKKG